MPSCGDKAFNSISSGAKLRCKWSVYETRQDAEPWTKFATIEPTDYSVKISSVGIATVCSDYDLDFSSASGVKAYIISGFSPSAGKVVLTNVAHIPAGTGFMVKGTEGTYDIPFSATDYKYANLLVGTQKEISLSATDGSYTNYVLANGTGGVGFYLPDDGYTLSANKAYLSIPTTAAGANSAIGICFDDEDDTTGFIPVRDLTDRKDGKQVVFDINGLRKQGLSKGLNIVNGKKILVK